MGIRIHKCVGYGLILESEDDARINLHSLDDQAWESPPSTFRAFFSDWCEKKGRSEDIIWKQIYDKMDEHTYLWKCIGFSSEAPFPKPFVLLPLSQVNSWSRRDNIIDWIEDCVLQHTGAEDRWTFLSDGIYPWNMLFVDTRTNKFIHNRRTLAALKHLEQAIQHAPDDVGIENSIQVLDHIASDLGFENYSSFCEHTMPEVPEEIVAMVEYLELFPDPKTISQLRPIYYKYWA